MRRRELIRQLEAWGCVLIRRGGKHDWYQNPHTRVSQPIPRHREIKEAVANQLSRGRLLDNIPQRQRRIWGSEIYIIEDRARRLIPHWLDQEYVTSFFSLCGRPHSIKNLRVKLDAREIGNTQKGAYHGRSARG